MTPTWVQVVDILIMTLQSKADSDSMVHAQKELTKMARLADNWVKHVKETESV